MDRIGIDRHSEPEMIVGLSGKAKSGKTTAAMYLEADAGFSRRSFAEVIRGYVSKMFGATERQLADTEFKDRQSGVLHWTWRDLMQKTGAFLRGLDNRFVIDRLDLSGKDVVVDDVRLEAEAERIKQAGGILIRLVRPQSEKNDLDITETALDNWPFDKYIDNSQDFPHLYKQLDLFLLEAGKIRVP